MSNDKKVAFLFGAGAEAGNSNFSIPTGNDYMYETVFNTKNEDMKNALSEFFCKKYYHFYGETGDGKRNNSRTIGYSKHSIITDTSKDKLLFENLARNCQDRDNVDYFVKYANILYELLPDEYKKEIISGIEIPNEEKNKFDRKTGKKVKEKESEKILRRWNNIISFLSSTVDIEKIEFNDKEILLKIWSEIFYNLNININLCKSTKLENIKKYFSKYSDFTEGVVEGFFTKFLVNISRNNCDAEKDEIIKISLNEDFVFSNSLDNLFHTIIDPYKYGKDNFMKIFNYYWSCYFFIIANLIKLNSFYLSEYTLFGFNGDNKIIAKPNYKKILNYIKDFNLLLFSMPIEENTSYYKMIQLNSNSKRISGVITTNYYNYSEKIIFAREVEDNRVEYQDSGKVSYINGKIFDFEFPEYLEVKIPEENNQSDFDGSKLFFPFMFGQSFVKPIIHSKQVNEFKKTYDILDNSDYLAVIGYNFNCDDNHLNAYVHEWLIDKIDRKLFFVTNESPENEDLFKNEILSKLKIDDTNRVELLHFDYLVDAPEQIIKTLFKQIFG